MRQVLTADTQRDITDILVRAARHANVDPIWLLGGAIAESDLNEHAARQKRWPDVSFGLWQPAVAFLGTEVAGLTRGANGVVLDTPANRDLARDFCFDAEQLAAYVAPRFAALLQRSSGPLEAWCRWNAPALPMSQNPNRANYQRGLDKAATFRDAPVAGAAAALAEPDIRWIGAHPDNFALGRGGIKPEAIVLHIAEGPIKAVDSWFNQIHPADIGPTSAHFCVGKGGEIHQYVNTANTAYANGVIEPGYTAKLIDDNAGINPNRWTISLEHEGVHGEQPTAAQFEASTGLTAWLFQARLFTSGASGVAVDADHILRHGAISPRSRPSCPGWTDATLDNYIQRVKSLLA